MEIIKNIFGRRTEMKYNLLRYTYKAWMKCYPNSNYDEWRTRMRPDNVFDFIDTQIETFGLKKKKALYKVVTIDDQYFDWLKKENKDDNEENMSEYSLLMDDDTAVLKMEEAGLNIIYEVLYLPIFIIKMNALNNKKSEFVLNNGLKNKITRYLETFYKHADVYVPGYLLKPDVASESENRVLDIAKMYFEENKEVNLEAWKNQEYLDASINMFSLYMPFIIRYPIKDINFDSESLFKINLEMVIKQDPTSAIMTKEGIKALDLKNVKPIEDTSLEEDLKQYFDCSLCSIIPTPMFAEDIMKNEKEIIKTLRKNKITISK